MRAEASDSVSWIAPRESLLAANAVLRTRDRQVALLLTDTTLVLQLTDHGLSHISQGMGDGKTGRGDRILGRILAAGVAELLDHGIAYQLSALRSARAEGIRLVLEDRRGNRVFATTEVNGRRVMEDFSPAEAERFAATIRSAIRRHTLTAAGVR